MNEKIFVVWYEPYNLEGEEDFIEIHAVDETEAARKARTMGYVTEVIEVEEV